jgi:hypothetical protein
VFASAAGERTGGIARFSLEPGRRGSRPLTGTPRVVAQLDGFPPGRPSTLRTRSS